MQNPLYFPILKWKQGEQKALQECKPATKAAILPILELPPLPCTFEEEPQPTKTCNQHLDKFGDQLKRSWNINDGPIAIDARFIDMVWLDSRDTHPLVNAINQARNDGYRAIPVTSPGRDKAYHDAVKNILKNDLVLRLSVNDFATGTGIIEQYLQWLAIDPSDVDCIIDLGNIDVQNRANSQFMASSMFMQLPYCNNWRNLVLAGTSVPENMANFNVGVSSIERMEWSLWLEMQNLNLSRKPAFADYCISSAELPEPIDPRFMTASASVRYTADNDYFIFKGRSLKQNGHEQFHELSQALTSHPCYSGATFSWGDGYINECANHNKGTGNLTTWRQVGTNHHIEKVVNQLASPAVI